MLAHIDFTLKPQDGPDAPMLHRDLSRLLNVARWLADCVILHPRDAWVASRTLQSFVQYWWLTDPSARAALRSTIVHTYESALSDAEHCLADNCCVLYMRQM